MSKRDGHYDGPDGMVVRVITRGADRGGANRSEMIGEYPEPRARQIAAKLATERGGRVVQDEHHPRALDVIVPNRGGRPSIDPDGSGPTKQFIFRCPTALIDRLDAHAEATGTTRSDLLRRGAEQLLDKETTMALNEAQIEEITKLRDHRRNLLEQIHEALPREEGSDWLHRMREEVADVDAEIEAYEGQ